MTPEAIARFMDKVSPEPNSGCWLWTGSLRGGGYGEFAVTGQRKSPEHRPVSAHRFSYASFVGPIPAGLVLDHLCRVRSCVNPAHLEPVTDRTNILRGAAPTARHAVKTHCPRGHAYDMKVKNGRWCRRCMAAANRVQAKRRDLARHSLIGEGLAREIEAEALAEPETDEGSAS